MARALIVVDVQPTFCEGGALGVTGGHEVAEAIADFAVRHRDEYDLVVTTQDWHIDPGDHFSETPDFVDTWPPHGVAGTEEAELHPALAGLGADAAVKKGQYAAAYSGFEGRDDNGRSLAEILRDAGVRSIDVVGIAESHCVLRTALDGVTEGLGVRVLTDLTVPVTPEQGATARKQMAREGVVLVSSGEAGLTEPRRYDVDGCAARSQHPAPWGGGLWVGKMRGSGVSVGVVAGGCLGCSSWSTLVCLWCVCARKSAWGWRAATGTVDWCREPERQSVRSS
ncbi:isochorismatase family protein [Salana multivorans]